MGLRFVPVLLERLLQVELLDPQPAAGDLLCTVRVDVVATLPAMDFNSSRRFIASAAIESGSFPDA